MVNDNSDFKSEFVLHFEEKIYLRETQVEQTEFLPHI